MKKKKEIERAHALLSSDNDESGNVRDHVPWRFEIMRQLLNKAPSPLAIPAFFLSLSVSAFFLFRSRHSLSIYAAVIPGAKIKRAKTLKRACKNNERQNTEIFTLD